jgi:hypothetical protein
VLVVRRPWVPNRLPERCAGQHVWQAARPRRVRVLHSLPDLDNAANADGPMVEPPRDRSTEALHARITALEAALAVSFAREDPTLEPVSDQEQPDIFDAEGRRVHPLLLAAFVDGGGAPAQEGEAEAGEVLTDGDSS